MTTKLKPLVKWVGGKTKLAPKILEKLPERITGHYYEMFCGGAAVFAALWNEGRLTHENFVLLNDDNAAIIRLFEAVAYTPDLLIEELREYERQYAAGDAEATQQLFLEERALWNVGAQKASRFVFLKQTAFNGLWRVNAKGEMNVAWGKYGHRSAAGIDHDQQPCILDEDNIRAWHEAFRHVSFSCSNALEWKPLFPVQEGNVYYLDPPYLDTFDGYTAEGFSFADHAKLLGNVHELVKGGAFVAYSNSVAARGLVEAAWPTATIDLLMTSYTVNVDGDGRGREPEMLVYEDGTPKLTATATPKRIRKAVT